MMKSSHLRLSYLPHATQQHPSQQLDALVPDADGLEPAGLVPDNDNTSTAVDWESILVWVGCSEAAERACELAVELSRVSRADVTLGIPGVAALGELRPLALLLTDSGIDVRVRVLRDRSTLALLDEVRHARHDLVIHTDRPSETTLDPQLLSRVCPCPVWTVRSLPRVHTVPQAQPPSTPVGLSGLSPIWNDSKTA